MEENKIDFQLSTGSMTSNSTLSSSNTPAGSRYQMKQLESPTKRLSNSPQGNTNFKNTALNVESSKFRPQ